MTMWNDDLLQLSPCNNPDTPRRLLRPARTLPRLWPRRPSGTPDQRAADVTESYGDCHTTVTEKR